MRTAQSGLKDNVGLQQNVMTLRLLRPDVLS